MRKPIILCLSLLFALTALGGGVRVSFLNDDSSLNDTLSLLSGHGCPSNNVAAFEKAVRHYSKVPLNLDRKRFPEPEKGFYAFKSIDDFVAALPHRLCDVEHEYGINCFWPVLSLSGLATEIKPDDPVGPILAVVSQAGQSWDTCTVATPRDAFLASYGPKYAGKVDAITGGPFTDQQICLMASLHSCHVLPRSTTEATLHKSLMGVLQSQWRHGGIQFPADTLVTMLHSMQLSNRFRVLTDHAGFLVPLQTGYMYIEKAGGQGPFLRIDLSKPEDLIPYYRSFITKESKGEMTHWLMTVNDSKAYWIEPQQTIGLADSIADQPAERLFVQIRKDHLRKEPSPFAQATEVLYFGQEVEVLATNRYWCRIKALAGSNSWMADGTSWWITVNRKTEVEGWIHISGLSKQQKGPPSSPPKDDTPISGSLWGNTNHAVKLK